MERIDQHRDLLVFVQIAETGGFGKAAKALGISTSQASRAMSRLEDALGTQLLTRTTRHVSLTEAGRGLYERARRLLADLDDAVGAVRDREGEPRGTLRVNLPVAFGLRFVAPLVAAFTARHPAVQVELGFDDRRVDLLADGWDLAVRIGPLADSSLVARRLGATVGLTLASPAYLERRGVPEHPRELSAHDALHYLNQSPGWRFTGPDGDTVVRPLGRFAANHGDALRAAALQGLGVARLPDFLVADDVHAGRLVRILEPWEHDLPIAAVYPPARHLSPKVRRLVDVLVEELADAPWSPCQRARATAVTA